VRALCKTSWRSILRNARRTTITVSSISFALAISVFFVSFTDGGAATTTNFAVRMQAGHITLQHPAYQDAPAIDLVVPGADALRRRLQVTRGVETTKLLVLGQGVARSSSETAGVAVLGVEPSVEAKTSLLARKIVAGSYLEDGSEGTAVIGRVLAERLKLEVGRKLVLSSNSATGELVEELLRIRGIFATGADDVDGYLVQVPLGFAQRFYGLRPDQVTQIGIVVRDSRQRDGIRAEAARMVAGSPIAVLPWEKVIPDLAAHLRVDGSTNLVLMGILLFLSLFTVFNTIQMSVLERTREFAMLLALGTPPWRLRLQVVLEGAMLALLGCVVGLLLGGLAGYWLQVHGVDVSKFGKGQSISGVPIDRVFGRVSADRLVSFGTFVFVATIAASAHCVRRISKIVVAEVLR